MLRRLLCLLLPALLIAPVSADAAVSRKKAIWGPVEIEGISQFPVYKDLGAGIYMTRLEWDKVAIFKPDDGKDPVDTGYDWPAEIDTAIDEAKRNGMDVALTVTGTPEWANGDKEPRFAPTQPKDYADFLTAAAKRYPAMHLWVIWDGPTQAENFQPVSASRYARLLDGAYAALKARSKLNRVIGGNSYTSGKIAPQKWISGLKLANGKRPRMDFYGHDASSGRRPDLKAKPPRQPRRPLRRRHAQRLGPRRVRQQAAVPDAVHAAHEPQLALRLPRHTQRPGLLADRRLPDRAQPVLRLLAGLRRAPGRGRRAGTTARSRAA